MATRVEEILTRVRDTLSDSNKTRWSDDRLIRLIDEAQKDICRRAKLLRDVTTVAVFDGQQTYELPSNVLLLDRVLYNNDNIDLISHLDLDKKDPSWETSIGTPCKLVFDKQNRRYIKLYPIPNTTEDSLNYDFGASVYDLYGIVTDMEDFLVDSSYGVTTGMYDQDATEISFDTPYGVVADFYEVTDELKVYYIKKPDDITSVDDVPEIDSMFDAAIKYYVTGKALRDDMDSQNRKVGSEELAFYDRELKEAMKDDSLDFTRNNNKQFQTEYRGGIDV